MLPPHLQMVRLKVDNCLETLPTRRKMKLLVAAWNSIDLMMRFLPMVEEEAFFLTGLPPDLALLAAAWVDLMMRFLPMAEEEAFFLTGLPPDLALLVAAWVDLVFLIFFLANNRPPAKATGV